MTKKTEQKKSATPKSKKSPVMANILGTTEQAPASSSEINETELILELKKNLAEAEAANAAMEKKLAAADANAVKLANANNELKRQLLEAEEQIKDFEEKLSNFASMEDEVKQAKLSALFAGYELEFVKMENDTLKKDASAMKVKLAQAKDPFRNIQSAKIYLQSPDKYSRKVVDVSQSAREGYESWN